MLNRDSVSLWIAFGGAIVMYLSSAKPPQEWGYPEYLQAASFLIAWASGKLQTSPLPGKPKPEA